jgi:hypothetical protein
VSLEALSSHVTQAHDSHLLSLMFT